MANGLLVENLLLLGLASLLLVAAAIDVRTYTIPNRLNLAIALAAPLFWWASGLPLWPNVALQLAVAAAVFAILAITFWAGMMGGGDVKLAAAVALWLSPSGTVRFLVYMTIAGGILTLALLVGHRLRSLPGRPKIPYGVAIAAGGLLILTQRFLNQFA